MAACRLLVDGKEFIDGNIKERVYMECIDGHGFFNLCERKIGKLGFEYRLTDMKKYEISIKALLDIYR